MLVKLQGLSDEHFADAIELLILAASDADVPAPEWTHADDQDDDVHEQDGLGRIDDTADSADAAGAGPDEEAEQVAGEGPADEEGLPAEYAELEQDAASVDDEPLPGTDGFEEGAAAPARSTGMVKRQAGRWDFTQHVPKDATKDDLGHYGAEILASESGHVVAAWNSYLGDESPADIEEFRVWAVHNAATGAVEATVRCGEQVWRSIDGEDRPTSLSPNGRYLTAGFVAFDLEQGTGHCLLGKEGQKDVQAVSVDDDGTVYGLAGLLNESERAYATVSMATGKANALPAGADLPLHMLPDAAVFYPPADGGGLLPTVHPRA